MIDHINVTTGLIIGVCAAGAALATAYKVLWYGKKDQAGNRRPGLVKGVLLDIRGFRDAILGREPVVDSITGAELSPRLPDIGTRMAKQEDQMHALTEVVATLAQSQRRIDDLDDRVRQLEEMKVERVLSRAEQIQLLSTMESAIDARPRRRKEEGADR